MIRKPCYGNFHGMMVPLRSTSQKKHIKVWDSRAQTLSRLVTNRQAPARSRALQPSFLSCQVRKAKNSNFLFSARVYVSFKSVKFTKYTNLKPRMSKVYELVRIRLLSFLSASGWSRRRLPGLSFHLGSLLQ